jgi:hypothetical protein
VVFKVHIADDGAKTAYIYIIKVYAFNNRFAQVIFIPEMEIIDGYFIKIKRPGFAFGFCGIARIKVINNKLQVGSAVFLFF